MVEGIVTPSGDHEVASAEMAGVLLQTLEGVIDGAGDGRQLLQEVLLGILLQSERAAPELARRIKLLVHDVSEDTLSRNGR